MSAPVRYEPVGRRVEGNGEEDRDYHVEAMKIVFTANSWFIYASAYTKLGALLLRGIDGE